MKYIIKSAVLEYKLQYKHCVVVQKQCLVIHVLHCVWRHYRCAFECSSVAALIQRTSHHMNISLLFSPNGFSQSLYFFSGIKKEKKHCKVRS